MGAIITRREYTNEFRPENTSWLLGNVGDRITLEIDVEIEISFNSSFSNPIESNGTEQLTRLTGSFLDDGFFIGSNISWDYGGTTGAGVVTVLTPTTMRVGSITGTFPVLGVYPFNDGTTVNPTISIESTDNVEGVVLNYNLIANSEVASASLNSLIDGTTPRFEVGGLDPADTVTILQMTTFGFNSGHSIFGASIVGNGKVGAVQKFTISIEFQIIPLFDNLSNFQNSVAPSFLFDNESLTDVFQLTFLPQINNPNVFVQTDSTSTALNGNVGWFDENFNGNESNYSVVGVNYTNINGTNVASVSKDEPTNFAITVNQTGATATSKYKFSFFTIPFDLELIQDNNETNYQNLILNDLNQTIDQATAGFVYGGFQNGSGASMGIEFVSITQSGSTVSINGQFQPNSAFSSYFDSVSDSNWNYGVALSLADESLATNISDRTTLLCEFNQLGETPISFVTGDISTEFLSHAQTSENAGTTTYSGAVEDEILSESLMFLDTAKNETIDSISFLIEGFDTINGSTFECEKYSIDTTGFPIDGDLVQQISVNTTRGFQMANGVNKNLIEVVRDQTLDTGTKKAYWLRYAIRPRWEYWIENSNVPNDLVDGTKRFDGKNQNWARLDSFLNQWELRFSVQTVLNSLSEVLNTRNSSNIYIRTFEESTVWDGSINHYNETKTVNLYTGLNSDGIRTNAILPTEKTLVEADFDLEDVAGDVGSISAYYGVIRIEVFEQGGIKGIEMLSSVLENKNDILKPISGSAKCKIEKISATKIRLSALIDNNFLNISGGNYKTSARIGYSNLTLPGIYGTQYGNQYG